VHLFPTNAGYIQELPIHDSGFCGQKQHFCMNYSNIFWPRLDQNKNCYMFFFLHFNSNMILACTSAIPVPAIYKNCLYMILDRVTKTGLVHQLFQIFLARIDRNKNSYMYILAFSLSRDSDLYVCYTSAGYIQELPIHDSGLCGQKRDLCINYTKKFFCQNRPKQDQLHVFSCLFSSHVILACTSAIPLPAIHEN